MFLKKNEKNFTNLKFRCILYEREINSPPFSELRCKFLANIFYKGALK